MTAKDICRPTNAVKRFRYPTCGVKRGYRCEGGLSPLALMRPETLGLSGFQAPNAEEGSTIA